MLKTYQGLRQIARRLFSSLEKPTYYDILGIDRSATTKEIRNRFFALAKTEHPDISTEPDASEKFKQISEAYAVLSIENLRKEYDEKLPSEKPVASEYSMKWNGITSFRFYNIKYSRTPLRPIGRTKRPGFILGV